MPFLHGINYRRTAIKPTLTFTNGQVTLCKDLIFGVCVLSEEHGWVPFDDITDKEQSLVRRLLDRNSACPLSISTHIYSREAFYTR